MLEYVHMGFNSMYEEEIILSLEQGVVVKSEVLKSMPIRGEIK